MAQSPTIFHMFSRDLHDRTHVPPRVTLITTHTTCYTPDTLTSFHSLKTLNFFLSPGLCSCCLLCWGQLCLPTYLQVQATVLLLCAMLPNVDPLIPNLTPQRLGSGSTAACCGNSYHMAFLACLLPHQVSLPGRQYTVQGESPCAQCWSPAPSSVSFTGRFSGHIGQMP